MPVHLTKAFVHAAVRSIFPLGSLEVVRNGEVIAKAEASGVRQAEIGAELRIDGNSWIACRAFGADYYLDEWGRRVFAHLRSTSPAAANTEVRRSDRFTTHHHGEADHLAWLERSSLREVLTA